MVARVAQGAGAAGIHSWLSVGGSDEARSGLLKQQVHFAPRGVMLSPGPFRFGAPLQEVSDGKAWNPLGQLETSQGEPPADQRRGGAPSARAGRRGDLSHEREIQRGDPVEGAPEMIGKPL